MRQSSLDDITGRNKISIHAPYKRVRRLSLIGKIDTLVISIHAPYKRVRLKARMPALVGDIISIHAPYKRVRHKYSPDQFEIVDFNPRTLQESATRWYRIWARYQPISIHAPYKRVRRLVDLTNKVDRLISIHAPYKRVRPIWGYRALKILVFQSTHPTRECDIADYATLRFLHAFQSTHPTRECDRNI